MTIALIGLAILALVIFAWVLEPLFSSRAVAIESCGDGAAEIEPPDEQRLQQVAEHQTGHEMVMPAARPNRDRVAGSGSS